MVMHPKATGLLIAFLLGGSLLCASARAWEGVVVAVPDGDSLTVDRGGRVHHLRLYGIDSPEYGQACWREARGLTREITMGRRVSVESMDTDRYGRIVALVWSQGRLVNSELVREGQAWVYPRYCRQQPLCADMNGLEQSAKAARLGVWRERNPKPPWSWRYSRP
jgi:endonuclease YncB( thermonuclease family)